jgi:hypothetical protein
MKITVGIFGSAVLAASVLASAPTVPVQAQQEGKNVCLNVTRIRNSHAIDNRTIEYRMIDGSIWRNTLAAPCPDLVSQAAGSYSQVSHDDWICANTQQITVKTGMVCRLGEFTRVK